MSKTTTDYQTFDADTGSPLDPGTPATAPRTTVDLANCHFGGTFRNPCFWILVGALGAIGVQYLLKSKKD